MSKVRIIVDANVDQLSIDNDLATDGLFPVSIENRYAIDLDTQVVLDVLPTDLALIEALKIVMDAATFKFMASSIFYIIIQNGLSFDLSQSYVRDTIATDLPKDALVNGQEIIARFEIPSFSGTQYREIVLYYNSVLNPVELAALEQIGILLTGNGSAFSIAISFETKISFTKPSYVLDNYAIDFNNVNQITYPI